MHQAALDSDWHMFCIDFSNHHATPMLMVLARIVPMNYAYTCKYSRVDNNWVIAQNMLKHKTSFFIYLYTYRKLRSCSLLLEGHKFLWELILVGCIEITHCCLFITWTRNSILSKCIIVKSFDVLSYKFIVVNCMICRVNTIRPTLTYW